VATLSAKEWLAIGVALGALVLLYGVLRLGKGARNGALR